MKMHEILSTNFFYFEIGKWGTGGGGGGNHYQIHIK